MAEYTKPLPVPNVMTQAYWEGAKHHHLLINQCTDCGVYNHPPKPICPQCHSENVKASPVSGKGQIYSYSIMHYDRGNPGFEHETPYAVVIVELEEQPQLFLVSNLLDCSVDAVTIGMPVEVTFQDVSPEITLPQFRPARNP